jgi:hypothetical protein
LYYLFFIVEFQVAVIYCCFASSVPEPNKTIDQVDDGSFFFRGFINGQGGGSRAAT